ncbi:MAG: FG-GAP repeat protein [Deltaproteobacteria bacterium]|nr:FG-GAP repeat protein [Deltaproteobacteria bacterium]
MKLRPAKRILCIICTFFICTFFLLIAPLSAHAKPKAPVFPFPSHSRVVPVKIPFKKPCYSKNDYARRLGGPFGRTALRYNDCDEDGFDSLRDGGGDCNDYDDRVHPGVTETCDTRDNNCNGTTDEGVTNACGTCGAVPVEVCDGLDNDCNGPADDGLPTYTWYADTDDDGYGDPAASTSTCASTAPVGYVANTNDCDDTNNAIHPGAVEVCDNADNDCAGGVDNGLADRLTTNQQGACSGDMEICNGSFGWQPKPTNHVKIAEVCDGIDNDCANGTDDGLTNRPASNIQGECAGNVESCEGATGYQPKATNYTPTAEICDGLDNDCAGGIDNGLADRLTSNQNGECAGNLEHCEGLAGYQSKATNYIPTAEVCDGLDNNCASGIDEALPLYTWYKDADNDTHGNPDIYVTNCYSAYSTYVSNSDDCNDTDPTINPEVSEDLTRIGDENCDGQGIGNLSAADAVFEGDTASDYTGFSMANVGDMDGDDVPDILVGAPGLRSGEAYGVGEAVLLKGDVADFIDAGAEIYHTGFIDKPWAGADVASAGDMNDDGVPDIIIGASDTNNFTGAAYLIYGPYTDDIGLSEADYTFTGAATNNDAGDVVTSAGDFNCDGYDDLAISATTNDNGGINAGEVYVVFGPLSTGSMNLGSANVTIRSTEARSLFGYSVVSSDLDHDGCSDLIVGAMMAGPTDNGKVYVFKGSESPASLITTASADAVFTGGIAGEWAGTSLGIKENGDLTGDGNVDLVIGSQYNNCGGTASGAVYIVSDPLTSKTLSTSESAFICGDGTGDQLGDYSSSLDIGDLDGDGVYDLVIGNESNGTYYGAAYLFMGPIGGVMNASDAEQVLTGEVSFGGDAGRSAIFIDDINEDGFLEIGIGDPSNSVSMVGNGRSYIIDGASLVQ